MLPKDFPPWQTVYWWFRRFVRLMLFKTIHNVALMLDRERAGREASPTAGIIDSQSVKAPAAGAERGFDGGKKITGRKRHIAVDADGRLLMVNLTPADVSDSAGAQHILNAIRKRWPWLKHFFADGAYSISIDDQRFPYSLRVSARLQDGRGDSVELRERKRLVPTVAGGTSTQSYKLSGLIHVLYRGQPIPAESITELRNSIRYVLARILANRDLDLVWAQAAKELALKKSIQDAEDTRQVEREERQRALVMGFVQLAAAWSAAHLVEAVRSRAVTSEQASTLDWVAERI